MHPFTKFALCISLFFIYTTTATAQYGKLPPFQLQLEAIGGTNIPGFHSFAFAQSGDKWLFIGGRTNGLHGLNTNDGFPGEHKNDAVIVIDTVTWNFYKADLNQLPKSIADPIRSTNMEYIQNGDYLYMIGGYGWDSINENFVTFPTLTAVHVNNMIDAVIHAKPIVPCIRQVKDTNLAVCGGDLVKLGNDYYLMFGHDFKGTYDPDKSSVLFTQKYSNRIKKFNLSDNGTTINLSNFSYNTDTTNFHRRDLTTCPLIYPDGSFGVGAYGGVFKKNADMPYLEPILLSSNGATTVKSYQQVMSQYTCAVLPAYDAVGKDMYTTFFGGISLYDYNTGTGLVVRDTTLPFINDITTLSAFANGSMEERVLPLQLPGLLGSNAKFILNKGVSSYANEVINLQQLPKTQSLVGYILGGIKAEKGSLGKTVANTTIFRVYITPSPTLSIDESSNVQQLNLYPNPASQQTTLEFTLKNTERVQIRLTDIAGKELELVKDEQLQKGMHQIILDVSRYKAGFYLCEVQGEKGKLTQKLMVRK
jgi:hypothetical protein